MLTKILTSNIVGLKSFCEDPITTLAAAERGTIAVLDNNQPVFYTLTPARLAQLLAYERAVSLPRSEGVSDDSLLDAEQPHVAQYNIPHGKFAMHDSWQPDEDFLRLAAIWGIVLTTPLTPSELASFIDYWKAEGKLFYHNQWLQKLARSVQQGRERQRGQIKRDINLPPEPDHSIPDGFRG